MQIRSLAVLIITLAATSAFADEGMWLFNNPPLKQLKEKYQFEPTPQWLEHLQKSSVRFNSGGSGSFVSANGLVITNHHVGLDTLQKLSSEKNNYVHDGFYAKTQAEEPRATDLELNVLMSIEDVTARVTAALKPGMSAEQSAAARQKAIAEIEKESKEKTGLRSDVVTLYQGGAYHLYRFKRYDDVRLVFAPEQQIAFYGGDPDNFENPRRAREDLFGIQNNRKRYDGYLAALLDPDIDRSLKAREQKLRDAMSKDAKWKGTLAAYDRIKRAQEETAKVLPVYNYYETLRGKQTATYRAPRGFYSTLFKYARRLLRAGDERPKPNGERFPEFRDSSRESLELDLFSTEPVYDDMEQVMLNDSLTDLAARFGYDDPLVQKVLAGKSPSGLAAELIKGTKVKDVAVRKQLYEGGAAAVTAAKDPMIELARLIDGPARAARMVFETQDETKQQAYGDIAKARFAIEGTSNYPDATFTLRLSYGAVRGYEENGKPVASFTDIAGLYARSAEHNNQPPFDLPPRWIEKKSALNLATKFNFVSDADIIGGNSGSPVVNQANEFVGIIFDGNIQSLVLDCIFSDKEARAVSVDSAAITEALRKVYDANALADELGK